MMSYDPLDRTRSFLRRQIQDAEDRLRALESVPQADTYGEGAVIRATIRHRPGDDPVTYLFIKIANKQVGQGGNGYRSGFRWYHTGYIAHPHSSSNGNKPWFDGWDQLVAWLTADRRELLGWEELVSASPLGVARISVMYLEDETPSGRYHVRWSDTSGAWELEGSQRPGTWVHGTDGPVTGAQLRAAPTNYDEEPPF